jgi:lipopolysaccharide/colanic/teichoic acid biosynthesis glycosyltransferase
MFDAGTDAAAAALRADDWPADLTGPTARAPAYVALSRRKRALDLAVAGLALLVMLPALLLLALLIRLESPGPALFAQRRTGLHGRIFTIFKFRTMTVMEDGEHVRHAGKGDARVTRLGAVLRKYSVDELPQLINVLTGDMSLVGPRPHAVAHDNYYGAALPTYARRFRARPGLTGLAQISGKRGEIRNLNGMAARVADDNAYIESWSFRQDLKILLGTLPMLLDDPQAY